MERVGARAWASAWAWGDVAMASALGSRTMIHASTAPSSGSGPGGAGSGSPSFCWGRGRASPSRVDQDPVALVPRLACGARRPRRGGHRVAAPGAGAAQGAAGSGAA